MKLCPPQLSPTHQSGTLLYDLVCAQQQDEEEICGMLYQNETLEDFQGSNLELKNCVLRGCTFSNCRMDNLSLGKLQSFRLPAARPCRPAGALSQLQAARNQFQPVAVSKHRLFGM